jgi:uncharacterized protein (DUF1499 family)
MKLINNKNVGLVEGQLKPCPESPNCVCSQCPAEDNHFMAPLPYLSSKEASKKKLLHIIHSHNRTEIVTEKENYLHIIFTIFLFNWKDDVEFYFDDSNKVIHFKSQSRTGYWDFGVNRRRMKLITKKYMKDQ